MPWSQGAPTDWAWPSRPGWYSAHCRHAAPRGLRPDVVEARRRRRLGWAAAGREQGVTTEQRAAAVIGNVTLGVARDIQDLKVDPETIERHPVAAGQAAFERLDGFTGRSVDDRVWPARLQPTDAADMIAVLVRDQDVGQYQALGAQARDDRFLVAGIDHRAGALADFPGERLETIGAPCAQCDIGAAFGQDPTEPRAEARRCTGNERIAPAEVLRYE